MDVALLIDFFCCCTTFDSTDIGKEKTFFSTMGNVSNLSVIINGNRHWS